MNSAASTQFVSGRGSTSDPGIGFDFQNSRATMMKPMSGTSLPAVKT
jgi:hypothetical protein